MTVLADSGIRRGSDVVKYMAAGASAVLVGRATLYGAAVAGERGALGVLRILSQEIENCMAWAGRTNMDDVTRGLVRVWPNDRGSEADSACP